MNYNLRVLPLGEMFGKAFNVYFDNFIAFVSISLIAKLPLFAYLILVFNPNAVRWLMSIGITGQTALQFVLVGGMMIFHGLSQFIETGIIVNIVSKRYLDQPLDFRKTAGETFAFLLPLIGLSILLVLVIGVGFLLFIIPAFVFSSGFALSAQILIVEKKKVFESMKRSWQLTNGVRLKIFGYLILIGLVVGIPNQIATSILQRVFETIGLSDSVWHVIAIFCISALVSPVQVCYNVLLYYNVRIEREGFALEHLAEEFSLANAERTDESDV